MPIFAADTGDYRDTRNSSRENYVPLDSNLFPEYRHTKSDNRGLLSLSGEESVPQKMIREIEMYGSLPQLAWQGIQEKLSNPAELAIELGVAAAVGVGYLALSRKPTMFGSAAQKFVTSTLENSWMARDLYVTVDIGERFISPALLSWSGKENDQAARDLLGRNIGGGVLDYSLGMFTFAKAGRLAFGKSPYIAPTKYILDPRNFSLGAMSASAADRFVNYFGQ